MLVNTMNLAKELIESSFENPEILKNEDAKKAVFETLAAINRGDIRVCEKIEGQWQTHAWVKKAVLLYFRLVPTELLPSGVFQYADKVPLKKGEEMKGVRVVPGAVVRTGTFVEAGAVVMPSFINIGAYVGAGSMVDTWATVGSCAQVGKNVHLSGGVGIGGVLEPPQADPVIIEDNAFLGSRCIVVEGVRVGEGAVLGANVVLTKSTKILDVSGESEVEHKGEIPPRSVVIPGTRIKKFPAGEYGVPAALIIGQRKASTDEKTSLNDALREYGVSV